VWFQTAPSALFLQSTLWQQLCVIIPTLLFNHLFSVNPLIISSVRQSLCSSSKLGGLLHMQSSTWNPPHCTRRGTRPSSARGCHSPPWSRSPAFPSALWWACSNLATSHTLAGSSWQLPPAALYPQQQNGKREKRAGSNAACSAQSNVSSQLPALNMQDKFSVVFQSMILES